MQRIFNREETNLQDFVARGKKKIGVISMCSGSGATFIATGLAWLMAQDKDACIGLADADSFVSNSITDVPRKACLFDMLGMDRRFCMRPFIDLFEKTCSGEGIRGLKNIDEHINFACPMGASYQKRDVLNSGQVERQGLGGNFEQNFKQNYAQNHDEKRRNMDECNFTYYDLLTRKDAISIALQTIDNLYADTVICDFGVCTSKKELSLYVQNVDYLIFVIDPIPSKLITGFEIFSELRRLELRHRESTGDNDKFIYILNKMNSAVNKRQVTSFLRLKDTLDIPFIAAELFYEAEYLCKIPLSTAKINKQLLQVFKELQTRIV